MIAQITEGVKVTVQSLFQSDFSNPDNDHYLFSYDIEIENLSPYPVQLIRRHWLICDSNGSRKMVEGEGVVGEQPVIKPGEKHSYSSGCNLQTDFGTMEGYYEMIRLADEESFEVKIPKFTLSAPYRLN